MLLAVTAQLSQEVAVSPFLWVLPLATYLVSFVLCFESDRWYARARFIPAVAVLLVAGLVIAARQSRLPIPAQIGGLLAVLFAASMLCHGELARRRPAPEHLTRFYLALALGGALGGISVPLLAPLLFRDYFELDASFVITWLLAMAVLGADRRSAFHGRFRRLARVGAAVELLLLFFLIAVRSNFWETHPLWCGRNFYGRLCVYRGCEAPSPEHPTPDCVTTEVHGHTRHGRQVANAADPQRQRQASSYFGPGSGVARAFLGHARRAQGLPMRVGIVGLGAGTLATYGRAGDAFRFFEINPVVVELARAERGFFTFLADSQAQVDVALGDARLTLERELREGRPGRYDVFVVDAFSSDSIPTHLLTREALELYKAHLAGPESILAIHVSNRFLDLVPLVFSLADATGLACAHVEHDPGSSPFYWEPSDWMLLSPAQATLAAPAIAQGVRGRRGRARAWTDDYTNVLAVLR
jgi:ATP:corrinoid adenosyltransferase